MSDVKRLIELEDRNIFDYITHDEVISNMSKDDDIPYILNTNNFEAFIDRYLEKLENESLINFVYQRTEFNLYEKVGITAFNSLDDDRKITLINELIESRISYYNRFGRYQRIVILSNIGFTFDKFPLPISNCVSGNECISLLVDRWNPPYEILENVYQTVCDNLNNTTNSSYFNYLKDRLEIKLNQINLNNIILLSIK